MNYIMPANVPTAFVWKGYHPNMKALFPARNKLGFSLTGAGDKAGDAGSDDGVEADVGFDAIAHLLEDARGQGGDIKVFLDAVWFGGGGEEGGAALDGPGEGDLGGGFVEALGDGGDDGIVEEIWVHAVAEGGEGE